MKSAYRYHIVFAVFLAVIIACIARIIGPGHLMNGDFALYIRQAQSIVHGDARQVAEDMQRMIEMSTYRYYSPVLYPWGYPLLLSPLAYFFGTDYLAFKILGSACFVIALAVLYAHFASKGNPLEGLVASVCVGLNLIYLYFCDSVLSELVYFLWVVLTLYAIHRVYKDRCAPVPFCRHLLVGFLLFMSFQTRTEGVLLAFSLFVVQADWYLKNRPGVGDLLHGLLPYLFAGVLWGISLFFLPAGFLEHGSHLALINLDTVGDNLSHFFLLPGNMLFFPDPLFCTLFWLFVLGGLYRSFRDYKPEAAYVVSATLLLLLWPYHEIRYWLSVFPFMAFFAFRGVSWLAELSGRKWVYTASRAVMVLSVALLGAETFAAVGQKTSSYDQHNPDVEGKEAKEVFHFIRTHAAPDDVVACSESRTVYLYTGRLSCNLFGEISDTARKADWYVLFLHRQNYLQYSPFSMSVYRRLYKEVFRNSCFAIYKKKSHESEPSETGH